MYASIKTKVNRMQSLTIAKKITSIAYFKWNLLSTENASKSKRLKFSLKSLFHYFR